MSIYVSKEMGKLMRLHIDDESSLQNDWRSHSHVVCFYTVRLHSYSAFENITKYYWLILVSIETHTRMRAQFYSLFFFSSILKSAWPHTPVQMRDSVTSRWFLFRKKVDSLLHWLFPTRFIPLYTMVSHGAQHESVVQCMWGQEQGKL